MANKKTENKKEETEILEKSITLVFKPITIIVKGKTKEELLNNAKLEAQKMFTEKIPPVKEYYVCDADVLKPEQAIAGTIIKDKNGRLGIITYYDINKDRLHATMTGHVDLTGSVGAFKLSNSTFEEARSKRYEFMKDSWNEGDSGYLDVKGEFKEVVIGKKSGKIINAFLINNPEGKYFKLTEPLLHLLHDEKTKK